MAGIKHLISALSFSNRGLRTAFDDEVSFQQEVYVSVFLIPLALYLGKTGTEKALLVSVILLVLITELINSAIETTIDRFGTESHPLSERAKDIGSGAVFMAIVNAVVVWTCIIFF